MSTTGTVDILKIGEAIWDKLEQWDVQVTEQMSQSVLDTCKETKKELKKATPKGSKRMKGENYRDCFTIKPNSSKSKALMTRTVWNTQYQLSHLLEDGHMVYTRLGKKTDKSAQKIGPLMIKKRSAKNGGTYAVFNDNKHTASYTMWKHGEEFASDYLVDDLKTRLDNKSLIK